MKVLKKRGSHVGVVLSFVIFITFLIFVYTSLEPTLKKGRDLSGSLDRLEKNILEFISEDLTIVTIKNDSSRLLGENYLRINKTEALNGNFYVVKDFDGNLVNSNVSGDFLLINWSLDKNFFRVYSSDGNLSLSEGNIVGTEVEGKIVSSSTRKYIFWSEVNSFLERYEDDYEVLREELNVFPMNFGFKIDYRNGTEKGELKRGTQDIFAKEISVEYLNSTADSFFVTINLQIW
jgi:hypothetical protein